MRKAGRTNFAIFVFCAVGMGTLYWWQQDWWAYVDGEPKFELPWWVQLTVSSIAGVIGGALAVGGIALMAWLWRRLSKE